MQTVLVLDDTPHPVLRTTLDQLGYPVLGELREPLTLRAEADRLGPDVIIVATGAPSNVLLETLGSITASRPRPVVMFAKEGDRDLVRKAVDCGVGAYVVDGWAPERLTTIIEAAIARFEAYEVVRKELATTRARLSERKLIEKAKGIVMSQRKLSEGEAYGALRKMAMDQNLALAEIARRVISVSELLG